MSLVILNKVNASDTGAASSLVNGRSGHGYPASGREPTRTGESVIAWSWPPDQIASSGCLVGISRLN
jgi:hypothetical protein